MGFGFKSLGGITNIFSGASKTASKIGGMFDREKKTGRNQQPIQEQFNVGTPQWLNQTMENDPFLKQLFDRTGESFPGQVPELGTDLTQQMMGVGQAQANQAAQGVSNSLAGRGGGIGSSLAIGAQARASAATQGVGQGIQADMQRFSQEIGKFQAQHDVYQADRDQLLNALTFKYNMLNQIMGGNLGKEQANLQFVASKERSDAQRDIGMFQAVASAFGGTRGGRGGGNLF